MQRLPGCQKSPFRLFDSLKQCQIFVLLRSTRKEYAASVRRQGRQRLRSTKILAALSARLAAQGLAEHLIQFEAGFAPLELPLHFCSC